MAWIAVALCVGVAVPVEGQAQQQQQLEAMADRPLIPNEIEAALSSSQSMGFQPQLRGTAVVAVDNPLTPAAKPALQSAAVEVAPTWLEPALLGRLEPTTIVAAAEVQPQIVRLPPLQAETVSAQTPDASLPIRAGHRHPAGVIRLLPTAEMPPRPEARVAGIGSQPPLLARIQPPSNEPELAQPAPPPNDPLPPPETTEDSPLQPAEVLGVPGMENPAVRMQIFPEDRPIGAITLNIAPKKGSLPKDLAAGRYDAEIPGWEPRPWEEVVYFWDAPAFCHRPLYYEEANLERLGYTHFPRLQPAFSGAHFMLSTLALPYSMK